MKNQPVFRPARKEDAVQIAVLMDIASRGLVSWVWSTLAFVGQSPLEVGRTRIREMRDLPSHFSRWTILENEDGIFGAFAGYMILDPYDPGDVSELPDAYLPLLELESLAAGCWFLMALSVFPEFRRKGFGSAMLRAAEAEARNCEAMRMAVTVSSGNDGALALYLRTGFKELARRKRIQFPGSPESGDWILLLKDVERVK